VGSSVVDACESDPPANREVVLMTSSERGMNECERDPPATAGGTDLMDRSMGGCAVRLGEGVNRKSLVPEVGLEPT
jgi:hypothetical protein